MRYTISRLSKCEIKFKRDSSLQGKARIYLSTKTEKRSTDEDDDDDGK